MPRHLSIECHHQPGNILFGIKFRISPVILEKKINFSEYKTSIFPLSYLIEKNIIVNIKQAASFEQRVKLLNEYFTEMVKKQGENAKPIKIVSEILEHCNHTNDFTISIQSLAKQYDISSRTLQRYFEMTTSLSSKKTLQILRVRKAVEELAKNPHSFDYSRYGYYDYSHFYKHLKQFFQKKTLNKLEPHLSLLSKLHKT